MTTAPSFFEQIALQLQVKHRLIAASCLRIALGIYMLAFYCMHLFQFDLIWGKDGIIPYRIFETASMQEHSLSLNLLSPSDVVSKLIVGMGIAVTFAFVCGFWTRISSVLFYVFTWSVYHRDFYILNGGDNLLYLLAFYLMFVDCGAYFSIDAARRNASEPKNAHPFVALVHNFGVLAIVVQLMLLYFTSAFYKITGHMWQDGTAIYYILRAKEFNLTPLGSLLYHNALLVTALTYMTILFQAAWPWLIWNRFARPFLAVGAFGLHISIAYFMGLWWFSFVMIAAEFAIFSDRDYLWFEAACKSLANRVRSLPSFARGSIVEASN